MEEADIVGGLLSRVRLFVATEGLIVKVRLRGTALHVPVDDPASNDRSAASIEPIIPRTRQSVSSPPKQLMKFFGSSDNISKYRAEETSQGIPQDQAASHAAAIKTAFMRGRR